jgi:ornithine carbamoyltransferase
VDDEAVTRHVLDVEDFSPAELQDLLARAQIADPPRVMAGKGAGLVFEKPSARTRNSAEMAVFQLGGHPVAIRGEEVGLGVRETPEDLVRTLASYHALVGARVRSHSTLERMVEAVDGAGVHVPVINLLSDRSHPCQALADLLTLRQTLGGLRGRSLAYVGDSNNVCRSLAMAAAMAGMEVRIASPRGFELETADVDGVRRYGRLDLFDRAVDAVAGADAVYTDVWTSMGPEDELVARRSLFSGFTVDEALLSLASRDAVFLHCLPAHRGEEVTPGVIDGPRSVVWRQAENRLHAMRGMLIWLFGEQVDL